MAQAFLPLTEARARQVVKDTQDLWNTRDPALISQNTPYSDDCIWRAKSTIFKSQDQFLGFLGKKWEKERNYHLRKELFAFKDNIMAVQFFTEFQDASDGMKWKRCYGIEKWGFSADGKMKEWHLSANEIDIDEKERWFKKGIDLAKL